MHLLETARRFTNHDVNNDICDVWQKLGKYGVYHESTIWSQLHTRRVVLREYDYSLHARNSSCISPQINI